MLLRLQNLTRSESCMCRGTLFCTVTCPNAVLVGLVLGAAKFTWLNTFRASTRISRPTLSCIRVFLISAASQELYESARIPPNRGDRLIRLLASCCDATVLKQLVLNHSCILLVFFPEIGTPERGQLRMALPNPMATPLWYV